MNVFSRLQSIALRTLFPATIALVFALSFSGLAQASVVTEHLIRISSDPYTNVTSQHKTEVEPDTLSFGKTIVSAFQVGRFFSGGASNVGWATSHNSGRTWIHGFLPRTTVFATPPGVYNRVSDPSVAYDPRHKAWLISYLGIYTSGNPPVPSAIDVVVSRSTDGGLTWSKPIVVAPGTPTNGLDKNWTICDTTASSPFYGNCYTEFDDSAQQDLILMSTSTDGGLTWGAAHPTSDLAHGIGGQPLVQASGKVIVPIIGLNFQLFIYTISSFASTNGGASWSNAVVVSVVNYHQTAGGIRTAPLPSAEIDRTGRVYVAWPDCRFESSCAANDIVLSSSADGITWSPVKRIPTNAIGSGVDHFIPGLGVDRTTAGRGAHLGLAYYYYSHTNCLPTTCQLNVGFVSSINGGTSWSRSERLAGPMDLSWLPATSEGVMVGDYISTSIISHDAAFPVFEVARPPQGNLFDEATYTTPEKMSHLIVGGTVISGAAEKTFSSPRLTVRFQAPTAR